MKAESTIRKEMAKLKAIYWGVVKRDGNMNAVEVKAYYAYRALAWAVGDSNYKSSSEVQV